MGVIHIMPNKVYYSSTGVHQLCGVTNPITNQTIIPTGTVTFTDILSGNDINYNLNMVYVRDSKTNKTYCTACLKNRSYAVMERMKLIQSHNIYDCGVVRNFNYVNSISETNPSYVIRGEI